MLLQIFIRVLYVGLYEVSCNSEAPYFTINGFNGSSVFKSLLKRELGFLSV